MTTLTFHAMARSARYPREVTEQSRGSIRASAEQSVKIHLGSGNIMMEPSDTYLCIVPARGGASVAPVFLPFDDDPMLSLILSKAFLLANDTAIKDKSIVSQINRR